MPVQRRFIDDDQVVQTLTANRADHPLDVRTLLRHSWRSSGLPAIRIYNPSDDLQCDRLAFPTADWLPGGTNTLSSTYSGITASVPDAFSASLNELPLDMVLTLGGK